MTAVATPESEAVGPRTPSPEAVKLEGRLLKHFHGLCSDDARRGLVQGLTEPEDRTLTEPGPQNTQDPNQEAAKDITVIVEGVCVFAPSGPLVDEIRHVARKLVAEKRKKGKADADKEPDAEPETSDGDNTAEDPKAAALSEMAGLLPQMSTEYLETLRDVIKKRIEGRAESESLPDPQATAEGIARVGKYYPDEVAKLNDYSSSLSDDVWIAIGEKLDDKIADGGWPCLADVVELVENWPAKNNESEDHDTLTLRLPIEDDQRPILTSIVNHLSVYTADELEHVETTLAYYFRKDTQSRREIDQAVELWEPRQEDDPNNQRDRDLDWLNKKTRTLSNAQLAGLRKGLSKLDGVQSRRADDEHLAEEFDRCGEDDSSPEARAMKLLAGLSPEAMKLIELDEHTGNLLDNLASILSRSAIEMYNNQCPADILAEGTCLMARRWAEAKAEGE